MKKAFNEVKDQVLLVLSDIAAAVGPPISFIVKAFSNGVQIIKAVVAAIGEVISALGLDELFAGIVESVKSIEIPFNDLKMTAGICTA